ncbi:MAG: MBG domain-containing protein [Imperialibacter sp.]|uniref:MBG domain-containing protein n=1 Tax=Imperialibacter sp. TaxID=2038411 RepID=UPI003A8AA510
MSRKYTLFIALLIFLSFEAVFCQEISWTWMAGEKESYTSNNPRYGEKNVGSPLNWPGFRAGSVTWTDQDGNMFLFGGYGFDLRGNVGQLNDLWVWDGESWTWRSGSNLRQQAGNYGTLGVADDSNTPGARSYSEVWVTSDGEIWLFGGNGYDSEGKLGALNDLWKWNAGMWTWMAGSDLANQPGDFSEAFDNNGPGGRSSAFSWVDGADNLWLFGGDGFGAATSGRLNDLWKWDGTKWELVGGGNVPGLRGVYGEKGISGEENFPGARSSGVSWEDSSGNFWLFGGGGYAESGTIGVLSDLWMWDGELWTWFSGPKDANQPGTYGIRGTPSPENFPGGRNQAIAWTDEFDNLWMYGGAGYSETTQVGNLNDLWMWDGAAWAWVDGSTTIDQKTILGGDDLGSAKDFPGGRYGASVWKKESYIFMYGGFGQNLDEAEGRLNDFWTWDGDSWTFVGGQHLFNRKGNYGTNDNSFNYEPAPSGRSNSHGWIDSDNNVWIFGGYGSDENGNLGRLNDLWKWDGSNWEFLDGSTKVYDNGSYSELGSFSPNNLPPARSGGTYWTDDAGNFYVFGGQFSSGYMNDLWKWDGASWMWVNGSSERNQGGNYGAKGIPSPSNLPGARYGMAVTRDRHGNSWMYGGYGIDGDGNTGLLEDLWKWDGVEWTWISGSQLRNRPSSYGEIGVSSLSNNPGGRNNTVIWFDDNNQLWLYGGAGSDGNGNEGNFSDLWKWDGEMWTWVDGSNLLNIEPVYGSYGVPSETNKIGSRGVPANWVDNRNNLWLFGGGGTDFNEGLGDFWKWDQENWVWFGGSEISDLGGNYGMLGTRDPMNIPGARWYSVSFVDSKGDFWLFGGRGMDGNGQHGRLNDLWKLSIITETQEITFDEIPVKKFGDGTFDLVASGGGSGQPIVFTSNNEEVATIEGNQVTIVGVGEATIKATQARYGVYQAAEPVERTLVVRKTEPEFQFAFNARDTQLSGGEVKAWDVDIDTDGNIYVIGYFSESADFDPGPGTFFLTSLSNRDIFVAKYTHGGSLLFAKSISSINSLYGNNIALTNEGDFWISGTINGTVDIDPGEGVYPLTANNQVFIAKYNSEGELLFGYVYGGEGTSNDVELKVDSFGNAILTGNFSGTLDITHPEGRKILQSTGNTDVFLVKCSPSGALLYGNKFGGYDYDSSSSLSIDAYGNAFVAGNFKGTIDFDPGPEVVNLVSAGNYDVFLSKFDENGKFAFAKRIGGSGVDYCSSITVDIHDNLWMTGTFGGTVDFDPNAESFLLTASGGVDIFIAEFSLSGELTKAKSIGGNSGESVDGITLDQSGNLYIKGYLHSDMDFDPGPGSFVFDQDLFSTNYYFAKYNSDIDFIYAAKIKTEQLAELTSFKTLGDDGLILVCYGEGNVDMDPDEAVYDGGELQKYAVNTFIGIYSPEGQMESVIQLDDLSAVWSDDAGQAIEIDGEGNVYVAGYVGGVTDFDPGPGIEELNTKVMRAQFLSKYDQHGNLIFAKAEENDVSFSEVEDMVIDGQGNIWITGYFNGTKDFDLGIGEYLIESHGSDDAFLVKYNSAGDFLFAENIGGTGYDRGNALSLDNNGDVLIAGYFSSSVTVEIEDDLASFSSFGGSDVFFAKFTTDGQMVFFKQVGGTGSEWGHSVTVDRENDIIISGLYSSSSIDFDPSEVVFSLTKLNPNQFFSDGFFAKYDEDGNFKLAGNMGSYRGMRAADVLVDSDDNIIITGTSSVGFWVDNSREGPANEGLEDVFIAKYSSQGEFIKVDIIGGNLESLGLTELLSSKMDGDDNIYITGRFNSVPDFDPGEGVLEVQTKGGYDIFLSKFNKNGNLVYAKSMGGILDDAGNDIAIGANGEVWVTGQFANTVDFNPTLKQSNLSTINNTGDIFLAKFEEKTAQQIVFEIDESKTYGDVPFEISASAPEAENAVSYASSDTNIAEVSGSTVTINGAGKVTLFAVLEGDALNPYTEEGRELIIEKAPLEIIAQDIELEYGVDPNDHFSVVYEGFVYGEDQSNLIGAQSFSIVLRPDVGFYSNRIIPRGVTSNNYAIHNQYGDLRVVAKNLYVIGNDITVQYGDDVNDLLSVTYDGFAYDDNENGDSNGNETLWGQLEFEQIDQVERGLYEDAIVPSGLTSNANYNLFFQNGDLIIDKRELTVTADDIAIPYGSSIPDLTYNITNFAFDDTEDLLTSNIEVSTSAVQGDIPGEYVIEVSGGEADNYSFKYITGTLTIEKLQPDITFDEIDDKIFGDPAFELVAASNIEGDITFSSSDESIVAIGGSIATIVGAGEVTITAHKAGDDRYGDAEVEQSLVVDKAPQTITFYQPESAVYRGDDVELVASSTSELEVVFQSSDESVAVVVGAKVEIAGVGAATITASQSGDDNYQAASAVERVFTVGKASQTITFGELSSKTFGDESFELSSNSDSGLEVAFLSSDEAVATIEGSLVTIIGAGETTITASQLGNANYAMASDVAQTLTVDKAMQVITFANIENQVLSTGSITLEAAASSGLVITIDVVGPATLDGASLTFTGSGDITLTANQEGNANYLAAESVSRSFVVIDDTVVEPEKEDQTITFDAMGDRIFGDAPFEISATASSGLSVVFSVSDGPATVDGPVVTITGAGAVTIAANQEGNEVYNPASAVSQTFVVNKAVAEVTLSQLEQVADGSPKGVQVSTNPQGLNVEITYNRSAEAPSEAGSYDVAAGIVEENYQGSAEGVLVLEEIETGIGIDEEYIVVFPNPVSKELTIDIKAEMSGKIYLFDMLGRRRLEKALTSQRTVLNLQHQPAGIYLLVIENERGDVLKQMKVRKE